MLSQEDKNYIYTEFMDRLKELLDIVNSNGKCGLAEIKNVTEDHTYKEKLNPPSM